MADTIVSSVFIRLRHPTHEAGLSNAFDATTQEWITDEDGVAAPLPEKGPFTPQQLDAKGLGLPVLMSQALQTAVRDRVAALEEATGLTAALAAMKQERDQALADLAQCQGSSAPISAVLELEQSVRWERSAKDAEIAELRCLLAEANTEAEREDFWTRLNYLFNPDGK